MALPSDVAARRARACKTFLEQAHSATAAEGINPSTLHAIKLKLVAFAKRTELFPLADNDGYGLYLTIGLPGKEAAPHDHGIWCANAAISGRERHVFYRRTDDGRENGRATVIKVGEVVVEPATGIVMADHDIHSTEVVGDRPAIGLSLYGYALARFPSVTWFHPEYSSVRATPSRRHVA